jgi:hypothetical protein
VLFRHYVIRSELVVPRKSSRLGNVAGSVIEYVIYSFSNFICSLFHFLRKLALN